MKQRGAVARLDNKKSPRYRGPAFFGTAGETGPEFGNFVNWVRDSSTSGSNRSEVFPIVRASPPPRRSRRFVYRLQDSISKDVNNRKSTKSLDDVLIVTGEGVTLTSWRTFHCFNRRLICRVIKL